MKIVIKKIIVLGRHFSFLTLLSFSFIILLACNGKEKKSTSKVSLDKPLPSISSSNATRYKISGKCISKIKDKVIITVSSPNVGIQLSCRSDNTFSGAIDVKSVVSDPAEIEVVQADKSDSASIKNNIIPLEFTELASLEAPSEPTHKLSGTCDSIFGNVTVKIEESNPVLNINESSTCQSGTFSIDLNIGRATFGSIVIHLIQESRTKDINHTLTASLSTLHLGPLGPLNSSTADTYTIIGTCDSSEQSQVHVTFVEVPSISKDVDCSSNNTFTADLQLENLSVLTNPTVTVQLTHGSDTLNSPPLDNNIILLSIEEPSLSNPLNLSNASEYSITGSCDPSLGTDNVEITMGSPNVTQTTDCDSQSQTFETTINASSIDSAMATITVTHSIRSVSTTIVNNIVPFSLSNALPNLILANAASYAVSGTCDPSLNGSHNIIIMVVELNISVSLICQGDAFSTNLNLEAARSNFYPQITIQADYGTSTASQILTNEIIPLSISPNLQAITESNKSSYTVSGSCDPSLLGNIEIFITEPKTATVSTTCKADKTFIAQINASSVIYNPAKITVTHGVGDNLIVSEIEVINNINVPLTIASEQPITDGNKSIYEVKGSCPSSGGNVRVKIGIPDTSYVSTICVPSTNTFSTNINASNISSSPNATITVTQGSSTQTATIKNLIGQSPSITVSINPLTAISSSNEKTYTVSGVCDANFGDVTITVGKPDTQANTPCKSNNTFTGNVDVRDVSSNPAQVRVSQAGDIAMEAPPVANNMNRFVTLWEFTSPNTSFTIPIKTGSDLTYNFTVDWGDGSPQSEITSFDDPDKTHIYENNGEYKITIIGSCSGFQNDANHSNQLIKVLNLGNMSWKDLSSAFSNNSQLVEVLGGNTSVVKNMSGMFRSANKATPDTKGWDTSNVTDMSHLFNGAESAIPETGNWNTSNVTTVESMFSGATNATPDTSSWNTSNVMNMSFLFKEAIRAIPDISSWDTSRVTTMEAMFYDAISATPETTTSGNVWDTSQVTNMRVMFRGAESANPDTSGWNISQVITMEAMFHNSISAEPDTTNWDTSLVTNMNKVFNGATNANPDTSGWDMSHVTSLRDIFKSSGLDADNYSKFLIRLNEIITQQNYTTVINDKTIDVDSIQYISTATDARANLATNGWIIYDGGLSN